MKPKKIEAILLDVGGVIMTNGWGRDLRKKTALHFGFDYEEMQDRHSLVFDPFEIGKMSFDDYLKYAIFFKSRTFSLEEVKRFIYDAVRPFPDMMEYIKALKKQYNLKIGIVSNEGRELAEDRTKRFHLKEFVDFFVYSSFVGMRKPDINIYKLALDLIQVEPFQIVYLDDRGLLVEIASTLGIQGIEHKSLSETKVKLDRLGLNL